MVFKTKGLCGFDFVEVDVHMFLQHQLLSSQIPKPKNGVYVYNTYSWWFRSQQLARPNSQRIFSCQVVTNPGVPIDGMLRCYI